MNELLFFAQMLFLAQGAGEYTLIGGGTAIITALTGAVTYLWKRAENEFDECNKDRAKLWLALQEMGYKPHEEEK